MGTLTDIAAQGRSSVAWRINSLGVLEQVASGVSRLTHTTNGVRRGYLSEEGFANLLPDPVALQDWTLTRMTVAPDQYGLAPDGSETADLLECNAAHADGSSIGQSVTVANATAHTFSFYVTAGDSSAALLRYGDGAGNRAGRYFDLDYGADGGAHAEGSGASLSAFGIEAGPFGSWRVTISFTTISTTCEVDLFVVDAVGARTCSVGASVIAWGGMLTATPYPVSYNAGTIAGDDLTMDISDIPSFPVAGATVYVEATLPYVSTWHNRYLFQMDDDDTIAESVGLLWGSSGVRFTIADGGAGIVDISGGSWTAGETKKMAVSWGPGFAALVVGGTVIGTATPATPAPAVVKLRVGRNQSVNRHLDGIVRELRVLNATLSTAAMQALTA